MPTSINAIEEEDVEKQTLNSAPDEEADEEEFEIERILGYEPNKFISEQTKKKIGGFFVKWKGYTSDDNSWVSVEDCHAEDLIQDFWEQHPEQRPKPKKQVTTKAGRGSIDIGSSKSKSRSRYEDAMEVDSDEHPPRKKQRLSSASKHTSSAGGRANGKSFSKLEREATGSADERGSVQAQLASDSQSHMVQRFDLMNIRDMKNKVDSVQTVELNNGKLFYYLTLKDGSKGAVPSSYVKKTIPDVAIQFYENHLRWRPDSDRE